MRKNTWILLLFMFLFVCPIYADDEKDQGEGGSIPEDPRISKQVYRLLVVLGAVYNQSLFEIPIDGLVDAAIEAILERADKYSRRIPKKQERGDDTWQDDDIMRGTVVFARFQGIGLIKILSFNKGTFGEVVAALHFLKNVPLPTEDDPLKGLIIDLRNNPGGLLGVSLEIAELFLGSNKNLLWTEGRGGVLTGMYLTSDRHRDITDGIPVVILVDKDTASAAEVVTVALRDNNRVVIIGEKTFGKGTAQGQFILEEGDMFMLTMMRMVAPNGEIWDGRGIVPDIVICDKSSYYDVVLNYAFDYLNLMADR